MRWRIPRRSERGSVSVEVAILAPAFIGLMAFAGVVGRTAIADEAIESAAHDAARAASIARSYTAAETAAKTAVQLRLDWAGLSCASMPQVQLSGTVDGRPTTLALAFNSPLGSNVSIRATVGCEVSYRRPEHVHPAEHGRQQMARGDVRVPLDRYRSRTGQ